MFGLSEFYRFLAPLGHGAEGHVHLVQDLRRDGQLAALKILSRRPRGGSTPVEFQNLAKVRHRSIARVLDTGVIRDPPARYFTTEYFAGAPLTALPAPFSWTVFETLLAETCSALTALNQTGYRHGDLKPAHVLFRNDVDLELRLIDLGHAQRLDETPSARTGTLPYTAPELWRRDALPGRNTDLYALGMICVETLCGRLPVKGADPHAWRVWHETGDRDQAVRDFRIRPPHRLRDCIRSLIEPDAGNRPRDPEALRSRLKSHGLSGSRSQAVIPLVGREGVVRDLFRWLLRTSPSGSGALVLAGPEGVGKTRVLGTLHRLAQSRGRCVATVNRGDIDVGEAALFTRLCHLLNSSDGPALLLVDDAEPTLRIGSIAIDRLWNKLTNSLRPPSLRGLIVVDPAQGSPNHAVEVLTAAGVAVELRHLGPLDREATGSLLESVIPDTRVDHLPLEEVWTSTGGVPGRIVDLCGARPAREPGPAKTLPPALGSILTRIPAPLPLEILTTALGYSAEEFWTTIESLGTQAPVVEGTHPDLRVHPLRDGPSFPLESPVLREVARRWADSTDPNRDWAPVLLRAHLGETTTTEPFANLRRRLKAERRWFAVAAVAETRIEKTDEERWDLLRAWHRTGRLAEAAWELERWRPSPDALTVEDAAEAAAIYEKSGKPEIALPFLRWAAEHETRPAAGLELLTDGVRIAQSLGKREEALGFVESLGATGAFTPARLPSLDPATARKLGALVHQLGRYELARNLFQSALAGARRQGRQGVMDVVGALSGLAADERRQNNLFEAERLLKMGIRFARRAQRAGDARFLEANLAAVQYQGNRLDESLETYQSALLSVRREGDRRLLPHLGLGIGTIHRRRGDLFRALTTLRRAARDARLAQNDGCLANILSNLGEVYLLLGDPVSAYELRKEVLRLARRINSHSLVCQARAAVGAALCRLGRYAEARAMLTRALAMDRAGMGVRIEAMIHAFLGEVSWLEEDRDGALEHWGRACRDALRSGRYGYACQAVAGLARVVESRGAKGRAEALLGRAEHIALRDSTPILTRIFIRWQRLAMRVRVEGWTASALQEADSLYSRARSHGLREIAAASALGLLEGGRRLPNRAARLLEGLLSRLPHSAREALAARLEVVRIPAAADFFDRASSTSRVTVETEHQSDWNPAEFLTSLTDLRDRWRAEGVRFVVDWEDVWCVAASTHDDRVYLPPVKLEAPGVVILALSGRDRSPRRVGTTVVVELRCGVDTIQAALLIDGGTLPPVSENLSRVEALVLPLLATFLEMRYVRERRRVEEQLDLLRAEALAERDRLETAVLSHRFEVDGPRWIAKSPPLRAIEKNLVAWAESALPILIHGESGTGKDHLARRLHASSTRSDRVLTTLNCSALPEALIEIELFGSAKGSFTGSEADRAGLLAVTTGGTLILDHIDDLHQDLQGKLLGVLESGTFRPVGTNATLTTDLRLITTSRRSPRAAIDAGLLREDLYFRLQGVEIHLPPLRERRDEILPLVDVHLRWNAQRLSLAVPELQPGVSEALREYPWFGNVREVGNVVQRWLIQRRRQITLEDVPSAPPAANGTTPVCEPGTPWREATAGFQRRHLLASLEHFGRNQSRTAKALGISRRHLQNLLEKLDLRRDGQEEN